MKIIGDYLRKKNLRIKNLQSGRRSAVVNFHLLGFCKKNRLSRSFQIQNVKGDVLFMAVKDNYPATTLKFKEKEILEYLNQKTNSGYKKIIFIRNSQT